METPGLRLALTPGDTARGRRKLAQALMRDVEGGDVQLLVVVASMRERSVLTWGTIGADRL